MEAAGNRKHKFNAFTTYRFGDGRLRGVSVGGGYRWQSKAVVGRNFTTGQQFYGNSYGVASLLVSYRARKLSFLNKGLTLQLNIDNLLDESDPLITRVRDTGEIYRWAILPPRTWRLTASVEF